MSQDSNSQAAQAGCWIPLSEVSGYEIFAVYPHNIRKQSTQKLVTERKNKGGYTELSLNGKSYRKHVLIAKQFIPRAEGCIIVDHINHNRSDNRLENLRWVTPMQNSNNRSDQDFVNVLPRYSFKVTSYNGHEFNDLWFDIQAKQFYRGNGMNYVVVHDCHTQRGQPFIKATSTNGKRYSIYHSKVHSKAEPDLAPKHSELVSVNIPINKTLDELERDFWGWLEWWDDMHEDD